MNYLLNKIYCRDNAVCHYCLKEVILTTQYKSRTYDDWHKIATLDHKEAKSLGGSNDENNLVLACHSWNVKKSNRHSYADFLEMTKQLREQKKMTNPNQIIACGSQATLFGADHRCRVESRNGALAIFTPYSRAFVEDLKFRIPAQNRSWNGQDKYWAVAFTEVKTVSELITKHYGETVEMPLFVNGHKQEVSGVYRVDYIGRTKPRGDGNFAFGLANNNWGFIFPEKVLRTWFDKTDAGEPEQKAETPKTFYQILGAKKDALPVDIKKAYYRMARMWHPDVCREADARERFESIKAAYDVLSDVKKRKRYDLGLKLQKQTAQSIRTPNKNYSSNFGYSPDLRCGLINLRGFVSLGKITVEQIFGWSDIEDENGNFLVSSWNLQNNAVELTWISRNVIF